MMKFSLIRNISDILPAIQGKDEFIVAEKEGYVVVNYNVMFEDTFQDSEESGISEQESLYRYLRREARGIIFDSKTGDIVRRPFHKFFNVNEREETQDHVVDLSRPHAILEKLDGSMIAPFIVNGQMIWGTKMGATDVAKPVEQFVAAHPQYVEFANKFIRLGWTPIFEWCSRKQRIVLDYKEDQLVLTAMRKRETGFYAYHETLQHLGVVYNIPVVRAFEPQTDMKAFLEYVAGLEDLEGFVVRFDDGHMVKLKCHWYLQIHRAKEAILQDRNIVELILDEHLDDVKAHLPAEDRDRLTKFENDFNLAISKIVAKIFAEHLALRISFMDRKTFAVDHAHKHDSFIRPILFRIFDNESGQGDIRELVVNTIRNNLSKTAKYEAIRDAWFPGVNYNANAN